MRKILLIILVVTIMLLTLCGCGSEEAQKVGVNKITGTEVSQEGPFGKITITVPDGWKYILCPVDSEKLSTGVYGIQLYPENAEEGYMEVIYDNRFGVCGTNLVTKKIELAGVNASMGTYNSKEYWGYISFEGKNENIYATTVSPEKWWEEGGARTLDILNTIKFEQNITEGAVSVYNEDSYIEKLNLSVDLRNISATEAIITYDLYKEKTTGEIQYGEVFYIEKLEGDDWVKLTSHNKTEYDYENTPYVLSADKTIEQKINWKLRYGELEPGDYRLKQKIKYCIDEDNYTMYDVYAYFIVR